MIDTAYIVAPLVGGVIGYITNALAIKMLFRPYNPKYLFGWKLPFTPGIIPKEKERIAKSIGGAISENLMNKEVLEKNLLSADMIDKIHSGIHDFFARQKENPETLREFLLHFLPPEDVEKAIENIRSELTTQVAAKLGDSSLGSQIADVVVQHVASRLRIDGLDIPFGGLLGKIGPIWGQLADMVQAPLTKYLAKNINSMLADRGPEIINGLLTTQIEDFSGMRMCDLLKGKDAQIKQFCDTVTSLYRKLITGQLPRILTTIDIPRIIEGRIKEMDMRETEQLIFKVMDKELQAIIWLGALLGLLMGSINLLL